MRCPTKKEYEEAMKNVIYLKNSIAMENERRESLINKLCGSQKVLDDYKKALRHQKEIVEKYQIYQEILAENN